MLNIPDNVRHEIKNLVPLSILNEIACFVFYDNHPVQNKICDIALFTTHGEVKEYYKREEVSSLVLGNVKITNMRILRNSRCELFYLLASDNEVIILSRKDELKVHKKVDNVDHYDIDDSVCRGQACLKIVLKDDAVPLIFDDKFENLGERAVVLNGMHVDESLPILNQLKRKLTQARYSIQCNEKTRREFMDLRKLTAFAAYQKLHPNLDDSMFSEGCDKAQELLQLMIQKPGVTTCNQKVVITLNVVNKSPKPLHDVAILLHTKKPSIVYSTQLFQRTTASPFWKEIYEIEPDIETAVVAVVDLSELQYSTTSRIEFSGVISYKKEDKDLLIPFESVIMSYSEFMGKQFDVLANEVDNTSVLSVLATTKKLDLTLRLISNDASRMTLPDMFCLYLEMEYVTGVTNAVIHKKSPHHILNGVIVVFENEIADRTSVAVHVRSESQVLPLIHYIHESIPHRVVMTSQNYKITAIVDSLTMYNEELPQNVSKLDFSSYAPSMLRQTAMILDYLDSCIVKMNESKDPKIQNKIGKEIDLFANGLGVYTEFRRNLLVESVKGVKCLKQCVFIAVDSGSMILDTE